MWTWQVEAMWSAFNRDPSESQATATSFMRHAFPADIFISRTLGQSEPGASAADAYWQSSKDAKSVAKTCILNLTMRLSDAGLRRLQSKIVYPDHRLPPSLTEDATRDRSNRLLGPTATLSTYKRLRFPECSWIRISNSLPGILIVKRKVTEAASHEVFDGTPLRPVRKGRRCKIS
jgi:hypothetical protein